MAVRSTTAGAGLDVFEQEPLPADHKLWTLPGVLLTPHTAGYGPYLDDRRYEIILDNCRRFLAGQPLRNLVDKARWFWPPLPETREKNRFDAASRPPDHQQNAPDQMLKKPARGALRENPEGGRSAAEGGNRNTETEHEMPPSLHQMICDSRIFLY